MHFLCATDLFLNEHDVNSLFFSFKLFSACLFDVGFNYFIIYLFAPYIIIISLVDSLKKKNRFIYVEFICEFQKCLFQS